MLPFCIGFFPKFAILSIRPVKKSKVSTGPFGARMGSEKVTLLLHNHPSTCCHETRIAFLLHFFPLALSALRKI
jgi:hypothetical protein